MNIIEKFIQRNKEWAQKKENQNLDFFNELSKGQSPEVLWIGCSDSRVPVTEITGSNLGEVFVHRNIANLVVHTDFNLMSVLQYGVEQLKVNHVVVCGHYGCGGVKASLSNIEFGLINKWIREIKDLYVKNKEKFEQLNEEERVNKLVEVNVIEQCNNLAKTSIVQRSWKNRSAPFIHGMDYSMKDGLIHELCQLDSETGLDPIYSYNFDI